ncbi:hypothetical protein H9N25_10610 [Pedobacter riviphilus]|uniref:DUF4131 domain-containing protein n=1 Tax=Pedobacter riviphilus TaxID=2766984 RepID=A0ABX6TNK8_9SPHI|nr:MULTISPECIES: hypothetical protein [Pedobacter]NII83209.1 hypothetical protein [Pedobacter sp. SG908]QNR86796.1 hypothetical protein H9N25_10610 [Pedobacter riviphilus]
MHTKKIKKSTKGLAGLKEKINQKFLRRNGLVPALIAVGSVVMGSLLISVLLRGCIANRILQINKVIAIKGVVDAIHPGRNNKLMDTLVLSNGYRYQIYPEWRSAISKGDSLIKEKGSLELVVFKKNRQTLVLNFMELAFNRQWKL